MKKALTVITAISFISLAIFGFNSSFGFSECIAKVTGGGSCPGNTNLLEYINFHLGSIVSFFNVSIGNQIGFILSLICLVLALSTSLFIGYFSKLSSVKVFDLEFYKNNKTFIPLVRLHLLRSSVYYLRPGPK